MFVVVAYDIANDRRRLKIMKMLEGYGEHMQESVFECHLRDSTYRKMKRQLKQLINPADDNVRLYHLCAKDVERIEEMGVGRPVQLAREFRIV